MTADRSDCRSRTEALSSSCTDPGGSSQARLSTACGAYDYVGDARRSTSTIKRTGQSASASPATLRRPPAWATKNDAERCSDLRPPWRTHHGANDQHSTQGRCTATGAGAGGLDGTSGATHRSVVATTAAWVMAQAALVNLLQPCWCSSIIFSLQFLSTAGLVRDQQSAGTHPSAAPARSRRFYAAVVKPLLSSWAPPRTAARPPSSRRVNDPGSPLRRWRLGGATVEVKEYGR